MRERKEEKEAPENCNRREDEGIRRWLKERTSYYDFFPLEGKLRKEK